MNSETAIAILFLSSVASWFIFLRVRKPRLADDDEGMDRYTAVSLMWVIVVSLLGFLYWLIFE